MSDGPIEFLSDVPVKKVGDTEMGGHDGLIQPGVDPLGGDGHSLAASEAASAMIRAGLVPLVGAEQVTGVLAESNPLAAGPVIDPVTGRTVPDDLNQDVTDGGATFSDQQDN